MIHIKYTYMQQWSPVVSEIKCNSKNLIAELRQIMFAHYVMQLVKLTVAVVHNCL